MTDWNKEDERIAQVEDWYRIAYENDGDWRDRAEAAYDFYWGELRATFSDAQQAELEEAKAPMLSINKVQPRVNMLAAMQRLNRYEPVVKAETDPKDVPVGKILTHVMRHINNKNDQDFLDSWTFMDACIGGRGYHGSYIDYTNNFFGDAATRYINPFNVLFDPTSIRPDWLDAEFVIEQRWFTLDEIQRFWGKRKSKLAETIFENRQMLGDSADGDVFTTGQARISMDHYRVKECWHRTYEELPYLADVRTGDLKHMPDEDEAFRIASQYPGRFYQISIWKARMNVTVMSCGVEMFHGPSPYESPRYNIFPTFCFYVGGRQDGVVESLKYPQMEINKRRSQMLHITNKTAHSPWVQDQNAVVGGDDLLEKKGTRLDVITKRPGSTVDRIPAGDFPIGLVRLEQMADQELQDVLGISVETLPTGGMGTGGSGRAIALRQQQGMKMLSLPMDNQRLTRRNWGRWLLRTIQQFYTTERVFRIDEPDEQGRDRYIAINARDYDRIKNDVTVGDYDVVVAEEPLSPTNRQAMYNTFVELLHQGIPIPPDLVVELSDMPRKEDVIARLRDYAQEQQNAGGGKRDAERARETVPVGA
ncbi:hypothetical protein KKF61_09090 [Patescibacteria group bacterium]|nr:hypothetical protein [Patescibacteria group bacterium]